MLSIYIGEHEFVIGLVGRLLLGLGAQAQLVCFCIFVSIWFAMKEMSFAYALDVLFSRLGSALSDILAPSIYLANTDHQDLKAPMWFGEALLIVSLFMIFIVYLIDYTSDAVESMQKEEIKKKKTEEVLDKFFIKKREKIDVVINLGQFSRNPS